MDNHEKELRSTTEAFSGSLDYRRNEMSTKRNNIDSPNSRVDSKPSSKSGKEELADTKGKKSAIKTTKKPTSPTRVTFVENNLCENCKKPKSLTKSKSLKK